MEWNQLMWYALIAAGALTLGYLIGTRRARSMKKRMIQQLNSQSLDLLDAKALTNEYDAYVVKQEGKNKLLENCLAELAKETELVTTLQAQLTEQKDKHFAEQHSLRAQAVNAVKIAKRATHVAREATQRLKQQENAADDNAAVADTAESRFKSPAIAVSVVDNTSSEDVITNIASASSRRDSTRNDKLGNGSEASMS